MEEKPAVPEKVVEAVAKATDEAAEDEYTQEDEIHDIKRAIVIKRVRIGISAVILLAAVTVVGYLYWRETYHRSDDLNFSLLIAAICTLIGIMSIFHIIHLFLSKINLKEELESVKKYPATEVVEEEVKNPADFSLEGLKEVYKNEEKEPVYVEKDNEEYNFAKAKYYMDELGVNSSKIFGVSILLFVFAGLAIFFGTGNGNTTIYAVPFIVLAVIFMTLLVCLLKTRGRYSDELVEHMQKVDEETKEEKKED